MKLNKQLIFILIVFFKTETVFSNNNLFNVNNIEIEKRDKASNASLADKAIKKGFDQLIQKTITNTRIVKNKKVYNSISKENFF